MKNFEIKPRPITSKNTPKTFFVLAGSKISDEMIQTVDARQLWKWLESKQEFSNWIKRRIDDGRFVEDKDFVTVDKKIKVKNQQVTTTIGDPIEYHISLDMAKHLAMMERNDKGFEAREYFIQCEKELNNQIKRQNHMPRGYPQMLEAARNDWKQVRKELIQTISDFLHVHDRKRKSQFADQIYIDLIEARARELREYFNLRFPYQLTRDYLHQLVQEAVCEVEIRMTDAIITGTVNSWEDFNEVLDIFTEQARRLKELQHGRIPLPSYARPQHTSMVRH